MKLRIILASITAGLLLLASPALARQGEKKDAPAKPAAPPAFDFRAHLQKLYDAWSDLDPAKAAPFYAKEANHVFFDVAPLKYNGWTQYADGVPKAFAAYSSGKFTLGNDLRVHLHGNLAWATATWSGELLKKDGTKENAEGRYTVVLRKRGDDWLIVHEHMSVPAPLAVAPK
jgi:ketosteroid isomerase-like protein